MKNFLRPSFLTFLLCFYGFFTAKASLGQEDPSEKGSGLRATQKISQAIIGAPKSVSGIYGDTTKLRVASTSNLPLSFSSTNEDIAWVNAADSLLILVGVGEADITITQPGNDTYDAATPVTFPVQVSKRAIDINALPVVMVYGYPPNQDELKQHYIAKGFVSKKDSLEMQAIVYLDFDEVSKIPEGKYDDKVVVNVIDPATTIPNYFIASNTKASLTVEKDESYMKIDTLTINGVKYPTPQDRLSVQTPCNKGFAQEETDMTIEVGPLINEVSVVVDTIEIYKANPNLTQGICIIPTQKLTIGEHVLDIRISARTGINKISLHYYVHIDQPLDTTGLFMRRWPEMLTVINNPKYNGGHSFSKVFIQKRSKDEIIDSHSYFYEPKGFIDPAAEYLATLYYIDESSLEEKMIKVCPLTFSPPETQAIVYPTSVAPGGTIQIRTAIPNEGQYKQIDLFNTMGMRILSTPLIDTTTPITMPTISGNYIVKVMGQEFKVIVR